MKTLLFVLVWTALAFALECCLLSCKTVPAEPFDQAEAAILSQALGIAIEAPTQTTFSVAP